MHTKQTRVIPTQIVQLAYYVPDAKEAALRWVEQQGAGPFFVSENIPLEQVRYQGKISSLDHTSAYGWCGNHMIELVQQNCNRPSVFRGRNFGLHHCAYFCDSLTGELSRLVNGDYEIAMQANTAGGIEFAFVGPNSESESLAALGHYFEIYQDHPQLRAFYAMIEAAADGWNGHEPLRDLNKKDPATQR